MRHRSSTIILFLAFAVPAEAQVTDSPRSLAMGGVGSDPVGSSAIIRNPAGLARAVTYAAEVQFFRRNDGVSAVGFSIVDSKTQPTMAVGVSYGFQFTDGDVPNDGHDARLAFAHPAIPDRLSLGVGLHYLRLDRGKDAPDLKGFTLDAGFLLSLSDAIHLAGIGHNLLKLEDAGLPRRLGGGISYTGVLVVAVDVLADLDSHVDGPKPVVNVGAEVLLGQAVPIRLGYEHDAGLGTTWVSGGLGFLTGMGANKGQLSLSYRQNLDDADLYLFGAGLTKFF